MLVSTMQQFANLSRTQKAWPAQIAGERPAAGGVAESDAETSKCASWVPVPSTEAFDALMDARSFRSRVDVVFCISPAALNMLVYSALAQSALLECQATLPKGPEGRRLSQPNSDGSSAGRPRVGSKNAFAGRHQYSNPWARVLSVVRCRCAVVPSIRRVQALDARGCDLSPELHRYSFYR